MDINLLKIDKIIGVEKIKPASFGDFSVGLAPGTGSAIGFDLKENIEKFSFMDWSIILKIVNASKEGSIVENITTDFIGKNNYRCKSVFTQIYEGTEKEEDEIINQLLNIDRKITDAKKRILFLPFIIEGQSEKFIHANFLLKTYKRMFLNYCKPVSFMRKEIKEPETYQHLSQKIIIRIKINQKPSPLLIKI